MRAAKDVSTIQTRIQRTLHIPSVIDEISECACKLLATDKIKITA